MGKVIEKRTRRQRYGASLKPVRSVRGMVRTGPIQIRTNLNKYRTKAGLLIISDVVLCVHKLPSSPAGRGGSRASPEHYHQRWGREVHAHPMPGIGTHCGTHLRIPSRYAMHDEHLHRSGSKRQPKI